MTHELTDEEIIALAIATKSADPGRDGYILPVTFARAVEAAVLAHLAQRGTSDEQIEGAIDASDGHWKEDVFCIGGPELMALLRSVAAIAASPQAQPMPEGVMATVPLEPTQAMLDAADKVLDADPRFIAQAWRVMVAASGVALPRGGQPE